MLCISTLSKIITKKSSVEINTNNLLVFFLLNYISYDMYILQKNTKMMVIYHVITFVKFLINKMI